MLGFNTANNPGMNRPSATAAMSRTRAAAQPERLQGGRPRIPCISLLSIELLEVVRGTL